MEQEVESRIGYDRYMEWTSEDVIDEDHSEIDEVHLVVLSNGPFVKELKWVVNMKVLEDWIERQTNLNELNLDAWFGTLKLTWMEVRCVILNHKENWVET